MASFTPLSAALGGTLIGLSAVLLWASAGRIAGASGIAAGIVAPAPVDGGRRWRLLFVLGLMLGAAAWFALAPGAVVPRPARSAALLLPAGLLVGYGTALAHGCTSGHGVCGLARLSPRSFAAVAVFLATGVATTALARHGLGWTL